MEVEILLCEIAWQARNDRLQRTAGIGMANIHEPFAPKTLQISYFLND